MEAVFDESHPPIHLCNPQEILGHFSTGLKKPAQEPHGVKKAAGLRASSPIIQPRGLLLIHSFILKIPSLSSNACARLKIRSCLPPCFRPSADKFLWAKLTSFFLCEATVSAHACKQCCNFYTANSAATFSSPWNRTAVITVFLFLHICLQDDSVLCITQYQCFSVALHSSLLFPYHMSCFLHYVGDHSIGTFPISCSLWPL